MRMLTFAPDERLVPFVRTLTVIEADQPMTRTLIPDAGILLAFRYRGFARQLDGGTATPLPDVAITGLRDTSRTMFTSAGGGVVVVALREGEAAAFFAEPLHELFGTTVDLDQLVPASDLERLASRLAAAGGHAQRLAAVEELLLARRRADGGDPIVAAAVRAIRAAHGSIRIGALARDLGIGRDRLEKRFRSVVGSSPKQLASILRLRRAIDLHRAGANLSRIAVDAGYFDQSHFIREFRRFTGEAPRRVLGAETYC